MKIVDITIGAEYAIGTTRDTKKFPKYIKRGRVLEVRATRKFIPPDSYVPRTVHDGVRVEYSDNNDSNVRQEIITLNRVQMPWDEWVIQEAARLEREDVAKRQRQDRLHNAMQRIKDALPPDYELPRDVSPEYGPARLEWVADLLEEAHSYGSSLR